MFSVIAVRKKVPQLSVVPVQTTNIPPKEVVVYTKQTQTTTTGHDVRDGKLFGAFLITWCLIMGSLFTIKTILLN